MDAHVEHKILILKRLYKRVMVGLLALALVMLAIDMIYPGLTSLSKKTALISKSVMIVLFLSVIPLLLSHLRKQLARLPGHTDIREKMAVYQRQFYIKAAVLSALCVLSMVVFLLSGDPMILVLLLAGLLFLYFERPNRLKIQSDLDIEQD